MALIEDVDYLLTNSDANSLTIFVDSKNRNIRQFQTPSYYTVDFEQSIRNVFGLEILDATLPVTMYNVDVNSNSLAISFIFPAFGISYNDFQSVLLILGNCPTFDELFSDTTSANFLICSNYSNFEAMSNVSSVGALSNNMIIFIGSCPLDTNGQYTVLSDGNSYTISDDTIYSLYNANLANSSYYANSTTLFYFEWKWCIDSQVFSYLDTIETTAVLFDYFLCNTYFVASQTGNYTSDTLILYLNSTLLQQNNDFINYIDKNAVLTVAYFDPVLQGDSSITSLLTWTYNSVSYQFFFDMRKSTMKFSLGFSSTSQNNSQNYSQILYRDNAQLFGSRLTTEFVQEIVSPGIINLESARFITLRCPEIENQMLGSYGNFKYSPGISLFKMTDTSSMQQLRFDFVNIVRKPFHPIGKLTRLTLSFENPDGTLYDFKGVDHQILMSIKYYSPKNITRVPHSLLNPHYNPNLLEYKYKTEEKEIQSTYNEEDIKNIILEQRKYFPS